MRFFQQQSSTPTLRIQPILLILTMVFLFGCSTIVGDKAPDWTLNDTKSRPHSLSTYAGQVRVLEFWATWCGPCHKVSPIMQAIHERFAADPVKVLAIHYNDKGDPATYLRERGFTYTALVDGLEVAKAYGVSKIPTIIVVDRLGMVIHRQTGFSAGDERTIEQVIQSAL